MLRALVLLALVALATPPARAAEFLTRGGDGALWIADASGRGTSVGGQIRGAPAAVATGSDVEAFVRGTDDALWTAARRGGAWSGFSLAGGSLTGSPAAVRRGDGVDVVARGADGSCMHARRDASGWSGWISLGGEFPERATFGLASRDAASLDVFARGMDGALWHSQLGAGGWTGFAQLGGALGSDPAACSWGDDRIDVVALAPDRTAQIRTWERASGWAGWSSLGGLFAAGTSLGITAPGPQRLVVAGIGTDERIWTNEMNAGAWAGWRALGDGRPASSPVPVATQSAPALLLNPVLLPRQDPPASAGAAAPPGDAATLTGLTGSIEARGLIGLDPSELVRLDRPRPPSVTPAVELTPDMLRRLDQAESQPFPGCDPGSPCVVVTLLGFVVDGTTGDPAPDGPGDEIVVRADGWYSPSGGYTGAEPFVRETLPHGSRPADATGHVARRVKAGSASADGGIARGDRYPARLSTSDSPAGRAGELPMRLFEGPLDGPAHLVLVLSAWEADGGEGPAGCCSGWNLDAASAAWDGHVTELTSGAVMLTRPAAEIELHDRPFGRLADMAAVHVLRGPIASWRRLAARSGLAGPGVLALEHSDFAGTARCTAFVRVTVTE